MMSFYWITRLDAIVTFSGVVAVIFGIAVIVLFTISAILCCTAFDKDDDDYKIGRKLMKIGVVSAIVTLLFSACAVFVPTTKEMCAIYVVDYLKDNEKVQKMPEQIIDAAANFLEEQAHKGKEKTK